MSDKIEINLKPKNCGECRFVYFKKGYSLEKCLITGAHCMREDVACSIGIRKDGVYER